MASCKSNATEPPMLEATTTGVASDQYEYLIGRDRSQSQTWSLSACQLFLIKKPMTNP